ncbi:MAG: FkbM family methyltransferase [Bacilli bacterium]|nr:FkbM family methyltransferase [Bacilli bacterium]
MLETGNRNEIETFYHTIKNEPEISINIKIRLVQYCTNMWNHFPHKHSEKPVIVLSSIRKILLGKKQESEFISRQQKDRVLFHEKQYLKLYSLLCDDRSKKTLIRVLKYRVTGDYNILHAESDFTFNQYFDKKIIDMPDSDVFVDCGSFIGDTTERFITRFPNFSKIYLYEPEPDNYAQAYNYLSKWENTSFEKIVFRRAGVGKERKSLKINSNGAGSFVSSFGDNDVDIVSLDKDIKEPVSFIKMDIEGFELDALEGSKNHIINEKPILAICVYHKIDDLWVIPEYILKLNPLYKLYLRQYIEGDGNNPWETVLYAK